MNTFKKILVVDDDELFLKSFSAFLKTYLYEVTTISNPFNVLEQLQKERFHCIILDIHMPGLSGLELLEKILPFHPGTPVIMLTKRGSIKTAVQSLKMGAFDFVEKTDDPDIMLNVIRHATEHVELNELKQTLEGFKQELREKHRILTESPAMEPVLDLMSRAAETDAPVLLLGETGTGKTYIARAIHHQSHRALKRFTEITLVSIPESLIESELFGHEKGAFTGATRNNPGKLKISDGGTIFLDEIGDLPLPLQVKLNQFLDHKTFYPLGSNKLEKVDVRIIAATNRPLEELRSGQHFREDLFYRLSAIVINLPPLRERPEDIWPLARYFLEKYKHTNPTVRAFHPLCRPLFEHYAWPGNIRELENMVQRLIAMSDTGQIKPELVRDQLQQAAGDRRTWKTSGYIAHVKDLKSARDEFEKEYIEYVLNLTNFNRTRTAELLNINRSHLQRKMKLYGLV